MKRVLVIAAHPDDEVLGCGATMARHVQQGDQVFVLILAEGLTSRDAKRDLEKQEKQLKDLQGIAYKANKHLGVQDIEFCHFPDNRMDEMTLLDIVKKIETFVSKYQPDVIYTHWGNDLNIDHRITNQAVLTACRPLPNSMIKKILFFEVVSSSEWNFGSKPIFMPNWFVNIKDTLALKIEALQIYQSEMRIWPHLRSVESIQHLSALRGSIVGIEVAEAFMLGRNTI